ncbi:MAG: cyclopropane-fatty-acyl-phospholipid synthase family protein [Thiolinea sp.]
MYTTAHQMTEKGLLPDTLVRTGIRHLLRQRLVEIEADDLEATAQREQDFLQVMRAGAIAEVPERANEQHYEVPAQFFHEVLGAQRKYSCAYWPQGVHTLEQAEQAALELTCEHAGLKDGQRVLELGCGWGSLSLFMARRFPNSDITVVSNSHSQGEYIRQQAAAEKLENLQVLTADMNTFQPEGGYDRIVSVEMFEHMRNWEQLMQRIRSWLQPDGRFFMHIFIHRSTPYLFLDESEADWMSRHFFSGGMMPSAALPLLCAGGLTVEQRWFWSGTHYERTANAWLKTWMQKEQLTPLFQQTYGKDFAALWWQRWRMFFMACAELFAYRNGREWLVGHYRFRAGD